MYSHPHSHDDDFLFEYQRDRSDPWFRTMHADEVETGRQDSFRDIIRDAIKLFRRLIQLAKRKPTLERRYEKEIARLEQCGMMSEADTVRVKLKALQ